MSPKKEETSTKRKIYRAIDKTGNFVKKHWWKALGLLLLIKRGGNDKGNKA